MMLHEDAHEGEGAGDACNAHVSMFGGLVLTNMEFTVPLDWNDRRRSETITVFVRKVSLQAHQGRDMPYLVYLQGGPGFASPRPEGRYGWLKRATEEYNVLLLDQRGTGLSNPLSHQTLSLFSTPHEQATYLSYFRADSIVKDCEHIRREILGTEGQWTVMGQSYGGFCLASYMSLFPDSLRGAIFAGGIPPMTIAEVDEVYRHTFRSMEQYNRLYYQRYPEDLKRVRKIANYLRTHKVQLPGGGNLTVRRFQQIGLGFGLGTFERVHYLLEGAFVRLNRASAQTTHMLSSLVGEETISFSFLRGIENMLDFETNPLYAILHESIYCQNGMSSCWAADRVLKEFPQFSPDFEDDSKPILFFGEAIFPWMFDDYKYLQSLKMASEIIAKSSDWGPLYDIQQLENNRVPCAAIVYYDDMYVPKELSERAARHIRGLQLWVTNEFIHSGIHSAGEHILNRLLGMLQASSV